jgi:hypothetical protein
MACTRPKKRHREDLVLACVVETMIAFYMVPMGEVV